MAPRLVPLLSSLSLVVAFGCTPAPAPDGGPVTDGGAPDGGAGADAGLDYTRDPACPAGAAWLVELSGSVIDEDGEPLPDALIQTCVRTDTERLLCLQPSGVDDDGSFRVVVPEPARCMDRATSRVLVPLTDRATVYCHVELPEDAPTLDLTAPYVLPGTTPATTVPPLGDEDQARTVVFADGLEVDVVPSNIFVQDYPALAARKLTPAEVPACALEGAPTFDALYAFSPEGNISGSGFAMRIPNTFGLDAGAEVELYAQGGLACELADETLIEEGNWAQFGTGTVSADGSVIEVGAAAGLPCFNWLGIVAP